MGGERVHRGGVPLITFVSVVATSSCSSSLLKAGLSEDVIIEKIRASPSLFDVNTDSMIGLKQAGVSDSVVEEKVRASRANRTATPNPLNPLSSVRQPL